MPSDSAIAGHFADNPLPGPCQDLPEDADTSNAMLATS